MSPIRSFAEGASIVLRVCTFAYFSRLRWWMWSCFCGDTCGTKPTLCFMKAFCCALAHLNVESLGRAHATGDNTSSRISGAWAAFYFYENHRHHGNETVYLGKIVALRGALTRKKKRFWASYNFRGGIRNLSTPVLLDCRWLTSSRAIQHLWAVIISLTFLRPVNGKWESLCQNAPLQGLAPACLSPSPRLSRSLSLPPRWSSQLGWMRLIFNPSCANGSVARPECSMHPNLSHRLIYSLSRKKRGGGKVRGFICGKTRIFLQGSFSDFIAVFLGTGLQQLVSAYRK